MQPTAQAVGREAEKEQAPEGAKDKSFVIKSMPLQEHNYWLTTANFSTTEFRSLPARVDIAVIGAGFTGLSAARTLAKRGAKVAVLESEIIGWAQVPATAAWCSPA